MDENTSLLLAAIAGRDDALKPHIDALVKAREDSEAAAKAIADERERMERSTAETTERLRKEKADWEEARVKHDEAAEEARKRINVQTQQLNELNATKEDVDRKLAAIAEREKAVKAAGDRAEAMHAQLTAALERVAPVRQALRALEGEIKTMREALG